MDRDGALDSRHERVSGETRSAARRGHYALCDPGPPGPATAGGGAGETGHSRPVLSRPAHRDVRTEARHRSDPAHLRNAAARRERPDLLSWLPEYPNGDR